MATETIGKLDTIEKLKYLLGNFNTFSCNIDLYSQHIKNTVENKEEEKN